MPYILSGVRVPVSPRAVRPREPGRPSPSTALRSPELAERMLRPRTPTDPGGSSKHIANMKAAKLVQANKERQIAALQAKLSTATPSTRVAIQKQVAALVHEVKELAGVANKEALAAVEKGASPAVVKEVAEAASSTSSVTPVIETASPVLQADGTVAVGPDAKVVDVPVTSDPGAASPVAASGGMSPLVLLGGAAVLGFFLLRK